MLIYWTLFAWPAVAALSKVRLSARGSYNALLGFALFLAVIIGLRYQVGVDWGNYLVHYDQASLSTVTQAMMESDAAYGFLNWAAAALGQGIWFVNLPCAAIFVAGVFVLCRSLPDPWLGFVIAVPFMAIVAAMNYTRQSAALGCVFMAVVALQRENVVRFVILILIGALFHRTAAMVFPLGALMYSPNRYWRLFWIFGGAAIAYSVFLEEMSGVFIQTYIRDPMVSDGTQVRVIMNGVAGACILGFGRMFAVSPRVFRFWRLYALTSMVFVAAIVVLPPLTAIDRVALYWMPLQIYAFGHLPFALRRWGLGEVSTVGVIFVYAAVQYVWLNFATYSFAWFPYRFIPVEYMMGRLTN